jgi:MFS family permease
VLLVVLVVGTLAYNFTVMLPLVAKLTFHGGAGVYSLLTSLMASGAVVGGLIVASRGRPDVARLGLVGIGFGVFILALALAPNLVVAAIVIVPMGGLSIAFIATANSTIQLRVDDAMRGRVMALYAIGFLGTAPLGAPLVGWISQAASPRVALAIGAAAAIGSSSVLLAQRRRRASSGESGTSIASATSIDGRERAEALVTAQKGQTGAVPVDADDPGTQSAELGVA